MGAISSGSFVRDLQPFIGKWFDQAGKELRPLYPRVFEVAKANSLSVFEPSAAYFGLPAVIGEGEPVSYDTAKQMYTKQYTMVDYGLGFVITRNMLDDGQALAKGEKLAKQLRMSMEKGREQTAFDVLNNAFDSGVTGADGKELCARDHPTLEGDVANEPSTDSDLTEASLEQAMIDIDAFTDYRGLKLNVDAKDLIIPTALQFDAHRILKSNERVGVADNDANALKDMGMVRDIIVSKYLDDSDAWFLTTDAPDGLKFQNRKDIELTTDNEFDTRNAKFKAIMRFDVGWSNPLGVYGSKGAA